MIGDASVCPKAVWNAQCIFAVTLRTKSAATGAPPEVIQQLAPFGLKILTKTVRRGELELKPQTVFTVEADPVIAPRVLLGR